ncbi:MAG: TPM domain-containing protein, partial [Acidobacteriota bacterium]|nr:TPM domain-containing protein [Acidobacteriota bacterium]
TDGPNLLSPGALENLDLRLKNYEESTGHQVLVWIGSTTDGNPLEDWTVRAFAAWKVGRKGLDDGLVLFVFAGDQKVRIEVGYGLEGQVPDIVASRIIQETILPRIKSGDADGALNEGIDRILKAIGGDTSARASQEHGQRAGEPISTGEWVIIIVLGLAFLVLLITHPSFAIWLLFNLLSGGRGGGSGGGGGGWSGGGGSSGGGGASGSW